MRIQTVAMLLALVVAGGLASAQSPSPAKAATSRATPAPGNMLQVMRGILYPNSNVIFTAQGEDPAAIKPDAEPSTSPNPLTAAYGGWDAVENSALALAESAILLTIPRACGNGRQAPIQNADWTRYVQELRDAGVFAYEAARSKDQDRILEAAEVVTNACGHCHDKYREKLTVAERCM
jgi:cytochrome c556